MLDYGGFLMWFDIIGEVYSLLILLSMSIFTFNFLVFLFSTF